MVRCDIGSGADGLELWVKFTEDGTPSLLYRTQAVPQAWHAGDNRGDYYIRGSITKKVGGVVEVTDVRGVSTPNAEGLFLEDERPDHLSGSMVHSSLRSLQTYTDAAEAWNKVKAGVTIARVSKAASADVVIQGYWNPDSGGPTYEQDGETIKRKDAWYDDGVCGISIACIQVDGNYPHLRPAGDPLGPRKFWIEALPHWGWQDKSREWTTDYDVARDPKQEDYQYLPAVLMHEFGHAIGLAPGHTEGKDIMAGTVRELEPCATPSANQSPTLCGLSAYEKEGAKAAYENHTAHKEDSDDH